MLARTHCMIKNIKKSLAHSRNYLLFQRTPYTETNILPIITPFSDMGKQRTAIIHRNRHMLATSPHSTPFGHFNFYQPTPNQAVFLTTLLTLHKHMVAHSKTPRTTTHKHPHTPIGTYPHITTLVTPFLSKIPDTPNSAWCHGQWI